MDFLIIHKLLKNKKNKIHKRNGESKKTNKAKNLPSFVLQQKEIHLKEQLIFNETKTNIFPLKTKSNSPNATKSQTTLTITETKSPTNTQTTKKRISETVATTQIPITTTTETKVPTPTKTQSATEIKLVSPFPLTKMPQKTSIEAYESANNRNVKRNRFKEDDQSKFEAENNQKLTNKSPIVETEFMFFDSE